MSRLLNTSPGVAANNRRVVVAENNKQVARRPAAAEVATCNRMDGISIWVRSEPDSPWHTCIVRSRCRSAFVHHRPQHSRCHLPPRSPKAARSLRRWRRLSLHREKPLQSAHLQWRPATCQSSRSSQSCLWPPCPGTRPSAHGHTAGIPSHLPGIARTFCRKRARP